MQIATQQRLRALLRYMFLKSGTGCCRRLSKAAETDCGGRAICDKSKQALIIGRDGQVPAVRYLSEKTMFSWSRVEKCSSLGNWLMLDKAACSWQSIVADAFAEACWLRPPV